MGLLQPWLLALGVGAAVPLLLHLLQRHQGPRVIFPALRYLRRAERESARRLKLRQWLLMLLRVLAVLLVALAAARPFLLGAGNSHEPSAIVLLLDNSLSTGAVVGERRLLDELKQRALEVLADAGPDDRFWLLRAGSPQEPALSADPAAIAARVRETQPTAAAADLPAALARARAILAAGAGGRSGEIQLLSDLQASELRGVRGDPAGPALLVWSGGPDPPPNHAIAEISVAGGIAPLAGTRTTLGVRLESGGPDSVTVRLFVPDRLLAAARVHAGETALMTLPAIQPGLLWGRAEADADALHADDRRFFATRVLSPPAVLAPGASAYVREGLAVLVRSGRIAETAGTGESVRLLSKASAIPAPSAGQAVVIVAPADPVELPAFNRMLADARIPWSFSPPGPPGEARFALSDSADVLQRALQSVRLARVYPLVAAEGGRADSVLLRLRTGEPWAVRGESSGGGRYILLASPLDSAGTSIPTSAAMIPLLDRIVATWSSPRAERLEALPGEEMPLPREGVTVVRPDSVTEPLAAARYAVPPVAGVYRVLAGDSLLTAFAVNPPARESDLRRVSGRRLAAAFEGWNLSTADSRRAWRRSVYHARLGLELWRPLLYALFLLLLIESAIAATGRRRLSPLTPTEPA